METQKEKEKELKRQQVERSKEILEMMKNNQTPVELVEKIAKALGVSDGTPKPSRDKYGINRFLIEDKKYFIADEETMKTELNEKISLILDDYVHHDYMKYFDIDRLIDDWVAEDEQGRGGYLGKRFDGSEEVIIDFDGALLYCYEVD